MQVHGSRGAWTLCRAVLALWPPKASQWARQRLGPLLRWPSMGADFGFGAEILPVSEAVGEAVMAD